MTVTHKLKAIVRPALDKFPRVKALLNRIRLRIRRGTFERRAQRELRYADFRTISINPSRITHCVVRDYDKWRDKGKVMDGDWDLERTPFEGLDVFQGFRDHFMRGVDWRQTPWYRRISDEIASGKTKWCCRSQADFDERCRQLEILFEEIRERGFKSQQEIPGKKDTPFELFDEISVCIDRDGQFLFEDGRHRLAIAKLLKINSIPVQITLRHKRWHEFRSDLMAYAESHQGKVYSPLPHPDLQDIPAVHGDERVGLIKRHLSVQQGSLLDIGAHWGYFCHVLEGFGFDCYAVESDPTHLYFLEKLRNAEGKRFRIINQSIFDYRDKNDFDVVLALNIFHHFLKDRRSYEQLLELLGRLEIKVLFFEPHAFEEPQMREAYKNYRPDEFVDFLLAHSCLTQSKPIGQAGNKRVLYMLWK